MIENETEKGTIQELYENNKEFLCKIAIKYLKDKQLSEDAVQNAFVDMISKKEKFKSMSDVDFKKWAITIVKSKSVDILRKHDNKEVFIEDTTNVFLSDTTPELEVIKKNDKEILSAEISKLKEIDRIILEYKYYHGLTYAEIAGELGLTQKNVEIRMQRAKNKLKRLLVKEGICDERKK